MTHTVEQPAAPAARPIFIDALNVAYWCGQPPSLRLPLALMECLLARGEAVSLYFDASAPHQLRAEAELYAELRRDCPQVIEVASGRSADQMLLRQARATGGCIISRDHYRDHRRRYRKLIDDPSRLLPGWVSADRLVLPALAIDIALPPSAVAAWSSLQSRWRQGTSP